MRKKRPTMGEGKRGSLKKKGERTQQRRSLQREIGRPTVKYPFMKRISQRLNEKKDSSREARGRFFIKG